MKRISGTAALIFGFMVFVSCGGNGGSDGGTLNPQLLAISGDYEISINSTQDDCGLNMPGIDTAMRVTEAGPTACSVDIPVEGMCNPIVYARTEDSLAATGTGVFQLDAGCGGGYCQVEVASSAILNFAGDGVTGTETDAFSVMGGDCSCVPLPCKIELALTGNRCDGCFDCDDPRLPLWSDSQGGELFRQLIRHN